MKIALTLQYNEDFREIVEITLPIVHAYAWAHGYSVFAHNCGTMKSPEIVWQRMDDVDAILPLFDAVVHLDADCLITNLAIKIEDCMEGCDRDVLVGMDCNGINDGFSIFRSTKEGRTLAYLFRHRNWPSGMSSPQEVMNRMHGAGEASCVGALPQRWCNSYVSMAYGPPDPKADWHPGDFILHLPGMDNKRRVELLKQHLPA
jgi:hypothetical protein